MKALVNSPLETQSSPADQVRPPAVLLSDSDNEGLSLASTKEALSIFMLYADGPRWPRVQGV